MQEHRSMVFFVDDWMGVDKYLNRGYVPIIIYVIMIMVIWKVMIQTITMTIKYLNDNLKCQIPFDWRTWYVNRKLFWRLKVINLWSIQRWNEKVMNLQSGKTHNLIDLRLPD